MTPVVRVIGYSKFTGVPAELLPNHADLEGVRDREQDSGSELARLVECAGRCCYDSYARGRSSGEYCEHILSVGHGCYDAETQVLTSRGWKPWSDVTLEDELATRTDTGKVEYHRPTRLIRYRHRGRMYRVEARGVDLLVTPNHNLYVCPTTTRDGRQRQEYQLISAEELGHRSHAYVKTGWWEAPDGCCHEWLSNDEAALLGFAIGDGNISGRSAWVEFNLRKERKIEWLLGLLSRLGWEYRKEDSGKTEVHVPSERLSLFRSIYDDNREKQIPPGFLLSQPMTVLQALFDGVMEADGHRGRTGDSFDTTSMTLSGQIQQLCLHIGLAANVCYLYGPEQRPTSMGKKPLVRLSIVRRNLKPEVNKYAGQTGRSSWSENWEGEVFCAEVPNHTLYVQRNGQPVWCGNSVLEHSTINFFVGGVSRGLTHELVRHRVGVAYSQRSTRYCDESESEWAWHPLVQQLMDDDVTSLVEVQHLESLAKLYYGRLVDRIESRLTAKGTDKATARKQARGAARGILGNALSTEIVVTFNLRSLRHFLKLRASEHADGEIRLLANEFYLEAMKVCPEYFGDYERRPCPDGIGFALTPKYREV